MAEAMSSVLSMDVTVVDEMMVRIAGTGIHKDTIGKKIIGNSVFRQVLEQSQECIIADVSTHEGCGLCDKRGSCMELAQLCCPILLGREAIGVIGLIAFSHEQQNEVAVHGERLLLFIKKMAELIAAKVVEKDALNRMVFLKNQLETVLNFVTEGVVAIDHMARIININDAAEKMLGVKGRDVDGFHINEVFPGTPIAEVLQDGTAFVDREIRIWHNGRHRHFFINARPMLVDGIVQGAVASFRSAAHSAAVAAPAVARLTLEDIVGNGAAIERIKAEARKAAGGSSTILLTGESGTGKEVFARAIHFESSRAIKSFIAVNCAAIPETLLESELFGYEEGSFTGARKGGKPGKFQLADGGTLFLDEIGDMPVAVQAKILRVLQEKTVERLGGIRALPVDVRIIAATNRDLEEMVRTGQFREDLYYRLNVFPIILPALRERREDIVELADYFLHKNAKAYGRAVTGFSPEATGLLIRYNWPGNIRELENAVECALVRTAGTVIDKDDLPAKLRQEAMISKRELSSGEQESVAAALDTFGHSVEGKKLAAASLGMSIATLYRKIRKYSLA